MTSPSARTSLLTSAQTQADEALVRGKLREFGLHQTHANVVKLWNTAHAYHNWAHCFRVAALTNAGAMHAALPAQQARLLLLASIYHDFGHTGDPGRADVYNITRAIDGVAHWLPLLDGATLDRGARNTVAELILATEASHARDPRTTAERLLMDADLLATAGPDHALWLAALAEETGLQVTDASTAQFLRGQQMHSGWGRKQRRVYLGELTSVTQASA